MEVDPRSMLNQDDAHKLWVVLTSLTTNPAVLDQSPLGHSSVTTLLKLPGTQLEQLRVSTLRGVS